jgi:Flp pilus assembly protein TadG
MKRLVATGMKRQKGVAAVEFALVAGIGGFLTLLIGIMELSRILFYMNSAAEATRVGARVAVVCDANAAAIKTRMQAMLNILEPANIDVTYLPAGCASSVANARSSCQSVTVSINPGLTVQTFIPFAPISVPLPPFTTTLTRESLDSTNNALCS